MAECKGSSCQSHSGSGSSESSGCGCGCSSCNCPKSCSCGCQSDSSCKCQSECKSHTEYFLKLADHAWEEVLIEKIKEDILKNNPKIDELAKLVSAANRERWHGKKQTCKAEHSLEEQIKELM